MLKNKINSLKPYSPSINNILKNDRYNTEDISEAERNFVEKHAKKTRIPRIDLTPGDIVVVLEGINTGKKVVFIKQLTDYKVVVSGVRSLNNCSAFIIDERYLLKLSSNISLSAINFNHTNLRESKPFESGIMESEPTDSEKSLEAELFKHIKAIPYMKTYISEDFVVDQSVEFYSQNY